MSNARLTFSPTLRSADAFYIAGMNVADAFVGVEFKGKFYAVASSLELGNFQKHSRCDKVFSLEDLRKTLPADKNKIAFVIALAAKKIGAKKISVGDDFPSGLFVELKKILPVEISKGALFPERLIKSAQEQNEIRKANAIIAEAIQLVAELLHRSQISKDKLLFKGKAITSEFLRRCVQALFLQRGLEPVSELIIAGGAQACDPHCLGAGALKPNELIIVDLFAPLQKSKYWGDMTRTFLRGTPNDAQIKLVETVLAAQQEAIKSIKPNIDGQKINGRIDERFVAAGFKTYKTKNGYEGFFHGTGHSLGLECHDLGEHGKRISRTKNILHVGEVYTVEPGLYYPSIGGCRIEDNGVVTEKGFKLLSKSSYGWIL